MRHKLESIQMQVMRLHVSVQVLPASVHQSRMEPLGVVQEYKMPTLRSKTKPDN